ncbi:amidohydrolase family protein [Singulisphaera sp. Ch08]|uniref:Amidohydrolase family protein n=1 Tax=Singulisphaera sp. Ch08 TaxID=3120278 RepID=A0AAU7CI52_9BACT
MTRQTERRRFLGQTIALAVAAGSGAQGVGRAFGQEPDAPCNEAAAEASGETKGMIPIIDTHQHLWDLTRFRLPWLTADSPLAKSFLMDDYLKAVEGLGVVKSVYMEVDVEPAQHKAEADYVIDLCRRHVGPMVGAVIGGRPVSDGFAADLDRYKDEPAIKGIRQVLHGGSTPRGYCLDPKFIRGIRLLGERGLSFDLCMRSGELSDGAQLIDACPGTSFILDHCGNPSVREKDLAAWRADISRLAERKNLVCKVSGIVASAAPDPWTSDDLAPIVNHVLSAFGPDRVIFGGDWPVCTLAATPRQWVEALRTIVQARSEVERRKLFHDNALRVYRLA